MDTERVADIAGSCEEFGYTADDRWAKLPAEWNWTEVASVASDSRDRVYVFSRSVHVVMVFDRDGTFLHAWGEGLFARPHGIFVSADDSVYCTDDLGHELNGLPESYRPRLPLSWQGC